MNNKKLLITSVIFCWLAGFATALLFVSGHVDDINMTQQFLESLGFEIFVMAFVFALVMRFIPEKFKQYKRKN